MVKQPKIMNVANMVYATETARRYKKELIDRCEEIKNDKRKHERLESNECAWCFYNARIGCSAMTEQACMCCGEKVLYGSTNTDALCIKCAKENQLCKHCGGDVDMRSRRKEWPISKIVR